MGFSEFLKQGWTDHATEAAGVAARLSEGLSLVESGDELSALANLANHVYGEHLGQWDRGVAFIQDLRRHKAHIAGAEAESALARLEAALTIGKGGSSDLAAFSESDKIRVLAVASSALAGQNQVERAQELFRRALNLAQRGLPPQDPANRALAVTGNNLACALEEKPSRTGAETSLMITAAKAGRQYWEIAGGPTEVMWGEYRLAMTYIKAGDRDKALEHAAISLKQAEALGASEADLASCREALARAQSLS